MQEDLNTTTQSALIRAKSAPICVESGAGLGRSPPRRRQQRYGTEGFRLVAKTPFLQNKLKGAAAPTTRDALCGESGYRSIAKYLFAKRIQVRACPEWVVRIGGGHEGACPEWAPGVRGRTRRGSR